MEEVLRIDDLVRDALTRSDSTPGRLATDSLVHEIATGLRAIRTLEVGVHHQSGFVPELVPTAENVAMYGHALSQEVHELMDELGWKRWKKGQVADPRRATEEFADVQAFLGLMLEYLFRVGVDEYELAREFVRKSRVNVARLRGEVDGYGRREVIQAGQGSVP